MPSSLALQVGRREGPVRVRERSPIRRRQGSLSRPTGAVVPRRSSQGGGGRRRSYEDHAPAGGGGVGRVDFLAPRLDQPSNRPVPRGTGVADPGAVPHYRSARVKARGLPPLLGICRPGLVSCRLLRPCAAASPERVTGATFVAQGSSQPRNRWSASRGGATFVALRSRPTVWSLTPSVLAVCLLLAFGCSTLVRAAKSNPG